jgi:hypothetical protein
MDSSLLELADKITNIGFPTLLVLILIGSRMKVWVWGWQLEDEKQRRISEVDACEKRSAEWRALALDGRRTAETWKDAATLPRG